MDSILTQEQPPVKRNVYKSFDIFGGECSLIKRQAKFDVIGIWLLL